MMQDLPQSYRYQGRPSSIDNKAQDPNQELFEYSDPSGSNPYIGPIEGFGFKLPSRSDVPTHTGVTGEAWLIEDSDVIYVYNGTAWRTITMA